MSKKSILIVVFGLVLLYPIYSIFHLEQILGSSNSINLVQGSLRSLQISIWISWVVMVSTAVYYKWTRKNNLFFQLTYVFLLIFFGIFGYYTQTMANIFEVSTGFKDDYTFGVLMALQNIAVAAALTGILQACVWWFTRRWHRRMK